MPLKSIKVLDLTRLLPGPYCTMLLADFGADVIKIEEPHIGDYARFFEPKIEGKSAFFHSLNRNKRSIRLDLKSVNDKNKFLQMVEDADVVVESFRPGVMERLGLDYDTLKRRNPRLIYCAITGYGQTGPYKDKPGHDINYLSYAGLLDLMGERGGRPVIPATTIADIGGGALPAVIGILMALHERHESKKGQFVDIAMMDGVISWLQTVLPAYLATDVLPKRGEQVFDGGRASYSVYETKDGRYLAVGAVEMKFWEVFCRTIEREDFINQLDEPLHTQYQMKSAIQEVIFQRDLEEWVSVFSEVEACVSPVNNLKEMIQDPHVQAREMIQTMTDDTLKHIGVPIKLSRTPGVLKTKAPE